MNSYTCIPAEIQQAFVKTLQESISEYFLKTEEPRKGNLLLIFKSIFAFSLFLLPYYVFIKLDFEQISFHFKPPRLSICFK